MSDHYREISTRMEVAQKSYEAQIKTELWMQNFNAWMVRKLLRECIVQMSRVGDGRWPTRESYGDPEC